MSRIGLVAAVLVFAGALSAGSPLAVQGHYFVRDGKPFFWLGDTNWSLFTLYTAEEAGEYLEHRAHQGFTIINVMMVFSGGPGTKLNLKNSEGNDPFLGGNPATPNPAFFINVDRVLAKARARGLVLAIMPCGGSSGTFVKQQRMFSEANVRAYGRWLGRRYRDVPNLIWVNGFDLKSPEHADITRALADGLREGDGGGHLITFHPGAGNSSSYFHREPWLAYNTIQTWSDYWRIHPLVVADYCRLPVKPVVLAEGAYEAGPEYPTRPITPLIVRKQAWWSYLAGGFHTYGHNDMWRKNPTWRAALDSPGAGQMRVLKQVFENHRWWTLVPDQSVFDVAGCGRDLDAAAVSTRDDLAVIYLSTRHAVSVDLGKISASTKVRATWVDPETGELSVQAVYPNAGLRPFTPSLKSEDAASGSIWAGSARASIIEAGHFVLPVDQEGRERAAEGGGDAAPAARPRAEAAVAASVRRTAAAGASVSEARPMRTGGRTACLVAGRVSGLVHDPACAAPDRAAARV